MLRIKNGGHYRVVAEQLYKSKFKAMGYEIVEEEKEKEDDSITQEDIDNLKEEVNEDMTVAELKEEAKKRDIEGYSNMKKEQLLNALNNEEGSEKDGEK